MSAPTSIIYNPQTGTGTGTGTSDFPREATYTIAARQGHRLKADTETDNKPFEFVNMGIVSEEVRGHTFNQANLFMGRVNWSGEWGLNLKWDSVNNHWLYDVASEQSCMVELGKEGVTLHATKKGVHFKDYWHAIFQVRADGTPGGTGPSSGEYICAKTTIFAQYRSGSTYTSDQHPWVAGDGARPFLHFLTAENKTPLNEAIKLEACHSSATGLALFFDKSRGSYNSKTAANSGDNPGTIGWRLYDGASYQISARIITYAEAVAATNNAPQSIAFQTGNSTSAGTNPLAVRMRIYSGGFQFHKTVQAVPADNPVGGVYTWYDANGIFNIKFPDGTTKTVTAV